MTTWTSTPPPIACPRCRMPITPAMPQVEAAGRAIHRECYIAWHFARTGRYPRRLGHGQPAANGAS